MRLSILPSAQMVKSFRSHTVGMPRLDFEARLVLAEGTHWFTLISIQLRLQRNSLRKERVYEFR